MGAYSIEEIGNLLKEEAYPISGTTALGSAEFTVREPDNCVAVALHNGSRVRPEVEALLAIDERDRFREEDPYTAEIISDFPIHLVARDSRFEYDLNWEVEECIYSWKEKKWGMQVWKDRPPDSMVDATRKKYLEFHALLDLLLEFALQNERPVLLYDIHAFCYRREQEITWWEDGKPDINLGTRYINRDHFAPMLEKLLEHMSDITIGDHTLKMAENALFPGGYLTRKYAGTHPGSVLVLAIEFKKIFMDEKTGELFPEYTKILADRLLLTKEALRTVNL
jgi:N-formylglutamate deformylase